MESIAFGGTCSTDGEGTDQIGGVEPPGAVAMSLYELERNGDVGELVAKLEESEIERVRARAAELLGGFPDHDERDAAVDALVDAARNDEDVVAASAIDSLEELGDDALETLLVDAAGIDIDAEGADWAKAKAFTEALSNDTPELRMAAANALGSLGHADATDALVSCFDDPDPRVRARAARACGDIGEPEPTDALADLLEDPAASARREAAEALGAIGNRRALDALLTLYDDDDERVRRIAVDAFGNFENERPVEYIVAALGDDAPTVRRRAVYSLIELLTNVPTDRSHDIRESVVDQLATADDRTVVGPLVEILTESGQHPQRRNTAWLLGRVADGPESPAVVDALIDALDDDDEMLRQFTATSLAELGGDLVEDRLLAVVTDDDRDSEVRAQACFAIGKVGGEESRRVLDDLIHDADDEEIRERAFAAIAKLGGRP